MRISEAIEKAMNGWGIARDNAEAAANELAKKYPDAAKFKAAFIEWLTANATAQLNIAALTGTLSGIAQDVWAGRAGKDPKAHQGNV